MRISLLLIFFCMFLFLPLVSSSVDSPRWEEINSDIEKRLLKGKKIVMLVKEVQGSKPSSAKEAMTRLSVLLRAGMENEARIALSELKGLCPEFENYAVMDIYKKASYLKAWGLVQDTLEFESFAEKFSDSLWIQDIYLGEFISHLSASGWTPEKIDAWFAAKPLGKNGYWLKQHFAFRVQQGTQKALFEEISASIKKNPEDNTSTAIVLLQALSRYGAPKSDYDLNWLPETVKPKLASEAMLLANSLEQMEKWELAAHFYRLAIKMPLTDDEVEHLYQDRQRMCLYDERRARFSVDSRESLAKCLLKMFRDDEAVRYFLEAAEIRKKSRTEMNDNFAGKIEEVTGQNKIGEQLKAEEKLSENNPNYWMRRVEYSRGSNDSVGEEEFLKKGLAITKPHAGGRGKGGYSDARSLFFSGYLNFLIENKRKEEALALIFKELKESPHTSNSSCLAVHFLTWRFNAELNPFDEYLWAWLAGRPHWGHDEKELLVAILKNAGTKDFEECLSRAQAMAPEKELRRRYILASAMSALKLDLRAKALLESVIKDASKEDQGLKEKTSLLLYEIFLKSGDWRNAEKFKGDLSFYHFVKLAVCAAKAGDKADAIRFWENAANIDPSNMNNLNELVNFGLRNELKDFYLRMGKELPGSLIPGMALRLLNAP